MIFMRLGHKQKEYIGKFLLDISKIILAVFGIGGLLPGSEITGLQILIASEASPKTVETICQQKNTKY